MMGRTRVLVVDDESAIHRFLTPALEANDYEVLKAETGAEALKRIAADVPDIVVLDLGLPDMDGKDVIARVREWSQVPVVVLSARDREAEKILALDKGRTTSSTSRSASANSWRACGPPCAITCNGPARRPSCGSVVSRSTFRAVA
jgi:CheY-like chemotaxis protein